MTLLKQHEDRMYSVSHGRAGLGAAGHGSAWPGGARRGEARQGIPIGSQNKGKEMYKKIDCGITGVTPLLLHNGQLADPLNEWTIRLKEITAKRIKTQAIHEEIARVEWYGSLYTNDAKRIGIPGEVIEAALQQGARQTKRGKDIPRGVICAGLWPLEYGGPLDPDTLFADPNYHDRRGVVVQRSRTMRTRPIFKRWSLNFQLDYLPDVINVSDLQTILENTGQFIGIGDYRPRFGRFDVEKFEEVK
jgi:hypothetical protein